MKKVINELKHSAMCEINKVGLTPRSVFDGAQEGHDTMCKEYAREYELASRVLSCRKYVVLDVTDGRQVIFESFKDAEKAYDIELKHLRSIGAEVELEMYSLHKRHEK